MSTPVLFTPVSVQRQIRVRAAALVIATLASDTARTLPSQSTSTGMFTHGFYVGASERLSRVAGQATGLTGAELSWIGEHRYAAGIAAYANLGGRLTNPHASAARRDAALDFGYGGVVLGYATAPNTRVSLTGHVLLGGGAIDYRNGAAIEETRKTFAVAEPSLRLDFTLTAFARVGLEGAYRIVTHAPNVDGLRSRRVRGASIGAGLRVGHF